MHPNVSSKHAGRISSHVSAQPILNIRQKSGIVYYCKKQIFSVTAVSIQNFQNMHPSMACLITKKKLSPIGTRILVHRKTTNCRTWSSRGTDGWYSVPALEHYPCVECYIPSTHITRIPGAVEFISTVIPIPRKNSEYYLRRYIADIITVLADPKPTVPSLSFGDDTHNAVRKTATLLNRAIPAPKSIKTTLTPTSPQCYSP